MRSLRTRSRAGTLSVVFVKPGVVDVRREHLRRPRTNDAIVTTSYSLVSTGTERTCLTRDFSVGGHWANWVSYPFRPGYSVMGRVSHAGRRTEGFGVGDRVVVHAPHTQHALAPGTAMTRVPDEVRDSDAAWFAIAAIAQLGVQRAQIAPGDTAVVLGAGILGQLIAQFARVAGAEVVVVGRSRFRLGVAAAHGAGCVLDASATNPIDEVRALTKAKGADLVFDATGNPEVFAEALRMARRFGTVILVGDAARPERQHLVSELLKNGLCVQGVHFDHGSPSEHAELASRFFTLLAAGDIRVGDLTTHRFSPIDAPAAYDKVTSKDDDFLGILFDWTET